MTPLYTQEEYDNAKSSDLLQLKCEHCGCVFTAAKKLITQEIKHNRGRNKFCSKKCKYEASTSIVHTKCSNCGKEISVFKNVYEKSISKHFFCNKSCAASFNNAKRIVSNETKNKISKSLKKNNFESSRKHIRICKVCGKQYVYRLGESTRVCCSKECSERLHNNYKDFMTEEQHKKYSERSRKNATKQSEDRRSKNEKYFCELCEHHFKNVKHNEAIFNGWDADVIIEDIKLAVLWNGKWHYEKITEKHSVEQVQNRDKIKIEEIKKAGYKPYVIKDMGKYNPKFVEEEFQKLINSGMAEWSIALLS